MQVSEKQIKIIQHMQESLQRHGGQSHGFLTLDEARKHCEYNRRIVTHSVSANNKHYWWFSDNHLYGYCGETKRLTDVVPCSSYLPMKCVARSTLPSGEILTVDDYVTIFFSGENDIHINSFDELIQFIDDNNLLSN